MILTVNLLVEWPSDAGEPRIERVLWLDPSGRDVVTIQIDHRKALPVWQKGQDVLAALAAGEARVLPVDPCAVLLRPENAIPEAHRQRRNKAWDAIAPLVEDPTGQVFVPSVRGPRVAAAVQRTGMSKKVIYRYLRRYWQGGQTPNTLLPRYDQCGGRGKEKQSQGGRPGRPSPRVAVAESASGVVINEEIREYFRRGIKNLSQNCMR